MTDLERFIELYKSFGIKVYTEQDENICITLKAIAGAEYCITFSKNGKFLRHDLYN